MIDLDAIEYKDLTATCLICRKQANFTTVKQEAPTGWFYLSPDPSFYTLLQEDDYWFMSCMTVCSEKCKRNLWKKQL